MGSSKNEFVVLCRVPGQLRAGVIKAHLDAENIPVFLRYESAGPVYGLTVDGLGEVDVMVPSDRLDEARQVIQPRSGAEDPVCDTDE